MNILWVEDFGGKADSGKNILNQLFGSLLSFDSWDNDLLSIKSHPSDLENFCKQVSRHCIYLCRNYFDYIEFKNNASILASIDVIILDIRLDNGEHVDFDLEIPKPYDNKEHFHNNAGFYIFSDLVHLGFVNDKICFMTGEDSTFSDFRKKCAEIYVPEIRCFEKRDKKGYDHLRHWLNQQESDYTKLRRGIIEGCRLIAQNLSEKDILFNRFITGKDKTFTLDDALDYLKALENSLPLYECNSKELYKLFIRTLSHEWEATDSKTITELAWIMKNTRNWIAHNSALFNALDERMVAYLFMINLRLMFNLSDEVQNYEKILLSLFEQETVIAHFPFSKTYLHVKNLVLQERSRSKYIKDSFEFNELANALQQPQSSIRHDKALFYKLLYQMFWLLTSKPYVSINQSTLEIQFQSFAYDKSPYLIELAKHIYKVSLPDE
jgi:hypothetical protein